jgi:mannose-1-phosphate guanylyltransferase
MKAFLLVGGLGTRLQPITLSMPKCLVEIGGKPLINYWVDVMIEAGIHEILVNLHHFPEMVKSHLQSNYPHIPFHFFHEVQLLGSAGTIRENINFFSDDEAVLVVYGDNFTNISLKEFIQFHRQHAEYGAIALFTAANPKACGIVSLNETGIMIGFEEKPAHPISDLANGGLYIFNKTEYGHFLQPIMMGKPFDIGFDILPKMIGRMCGWPINDFYLDIGTHENLQIARDYVNLNNNL